MAIRIRVPSAGLTRFGALVILIGCILPQITYLGHWPVPGVTSATAESEEHEHEAEAGIEGEAGIEHSLHCHTGPSKCGGPQAMVASVWAGEDSGLLGLDNKPQALASDATTLRVEPPLSRILQPPQTVV